MKAWSVNSDYVSTYTAVGKSAPAVVKKLLKEAERPAKDEGLTFTPTEVMLHVVFVYEDVLNTTGESFHGLLTVVD